jgi:hypothetical protein
MKVKSPLLLEGFSPFDKARLNHGVPTLDEALAHRMLGEVERFCSRSGRAVEEEMEFVLDLNVVDDPAQRHAYKSFFGYTWAERRRSRNRGRDAREFAPLNEDGSQY